MAEFRPFDLGNVLSTGEAIKTSRFNRQAAQEQMDLAKNQMDRTKIVDNLKFGLGIIRAAKQNPQLFEVYKPELISRQIIGPQSTLDDPSELEQFEQQLQASLDAYEPPKWGQPFAANQGGQDVFVQTTPGGRTRTVDGYAPPSKKSDVLSPEAFQQRLALNQARTEAAAQAKIDEANAKRAAESAANQPKEAAKTEAAGEKYQMLDSVIDDIKAQAGFWTTGFLGQQLAGIGGTPAHDLQQNLGTLQANVGFDRLQEMRDNSVTGGALGQVSEKENKLLQAVWGALEQSQSEAQFKRNLERVRKQVKASWDRIRRAFYDKYGSMRPTTEAGQKDYDLVFGGAQSTPVQQVDDPLGIRK